MVKFRIYAWCDVCLYTHWHNQRVLQGVWVFISFVCTTKVLRLIKETLCARRDFKRTDTRSTNSVRTTYPTIRHVSADGWTETEHHPIGYGECKWFNNSNNELQTCIGHLNDYVLFKWNDKIKFLWNNKVENIRL